MNIQLSTFFFIILINFITAFVCPTRNGTYPHEWNKAVYYICSKNCAYLKNWPPNSYYSSNMNQCQLEPADWSLLFDLTGRYQWPYSTIFREVVQVGYNVQWVNEDAVAIYTFIGRYINEITITGLETGIIRGTNCIIIKEFDLSVSGIRKFCSSRVAFHCYTRTCGQTLLANECFTY